MKKLLIGLAICLIIAGWQKPAKAEINLSEQLKKIPAINQSILFNITDSELDYASSITFMQLLNKAVSVDVGWSPKTQLLGLVSFKLIEVGKWITFPILDKVVIEPLIWYGFDRIEDLKEFGEGNLGVGIKILSVKF
mgnify:CR=1 FL=1